jgi:hypothetical protein
VFFSPLLELSPTRPTCLYHFHHSIPVLLETTPTKAKTISVILNAVKDLLDERTVCRALGAVRGQMFRSAQHDKGVLFVILRCAQDDKLVY